ncbi:MAG: hypothetical protein NTW58_02710 [Actinobacteria bacterium]|nr:hypothetical protein [Actinomycetota bacterium]
MRTGLPASAALLAFASVVVGAASLAGGASPAAAAPIPQRPAPPVLDDLRGPHARETARALPLALGALGALPTARETAAFAAGSIAVAVVFVESDGSLEAFLPAAGQYGAPRTVTTRFEPISRPSGQFNKDYRLSDAGWRWQIMDKLGYAHDGIDDSPLPERAYADSVRRETGADWAFVLYVVDSLRDADGMFPDGAIAYTADLYGPYMVLTYDNDGYRFRHFDAVLAHEMGHVFGALDEYAPPRPGYPSTGELASGYLGVRNRNALKGGTTDLPCIMRGSQATLDAFAMGELCPSSVGQTGLRDRDGDARPDVVATRPRFDAVRPTAVNGGVFTVTGLVREQPWPRGASSVGTPFRHDISIFVPHDLQFRVDGGEWLPLVATDGRFDEPVEKWTLMTAALAAGTHALEVQGTTGEPAGFVKELSAGP